MLKKFTAFTTEKKDVTVQTIDRKNASKKSTESQNEKIPETEVKVTKVEKLTTKVKEHKMENFEFSGKIVNLQSQIKPSATILMLENNKISKEKLHYIISKQTNDSLVILKYNEKADIKLTEFVNTILTYYKRNEKLKEPFNQIVVEGTDQFSIIKNIPNITFGERKLIEVLNDDLIKLLK